MKKWTAMLLTLTLLFLLAACGRGGDAPLTRGAMPEGDADSVSDIPDAPDATGAVDPTGAEAQDAPAVTEPEEVDWDLATCQPEEAYREIEHYNVDPRGYRGMSLRLTGEFSMVLDHGKTFYYCGVRDDDGCVENLELRFPGDGSLPAGFPEEGSTVTIWGVLDYYDAGNGVNCCVLTDTRLSRVQGDGRD